MKDAPQARLTAEAAIARRLRRQAGLCNRLGSPLYAALLEEAAADTERGGPASEVLAGHERDPPGSALGLRLMGAVHRLVLEGRLPELAALYPSTGGTADPPRACPIFIAALADERDELRPLLERRVQTNEVWRSAALLGGFCVVAAETRLPLRVLEVGASAGLNLRFERYSYFSGAAAWGERDSPVRFVSVFEGERNPPQDVAPVVIERRGCDASPLDPGARADRLTLLSYVWPDQRDRLQLLRAALEFAAGMPVTIDRADAAAWAERMLAGLQDDVATVLFHSIVMQYLDERTTERLGTAIEAAGRRATKARPFAWLRLEPGGDQAEVRLNLWPGGEERLLATCGFQRGPVRWLGGEPAGLDGA